MELSPTQQLACNGQPGIPKPGTAPIVSFSIGAVTSILTGLTDGAAAVALAVLFAGLSFDAGAFCGDGDVGDPGMSVQDWADALDYGNPAVNLPAAAKAQQWFKHVIFPILCDCTDGSAPPPNTPTAPPALDTSPNTPPATLGPNCWHNETTYQPNVPNGNHDLTPQLPNIPPVIANVTPTPRGIQTPLPSSISVTTSCDTTGSNAEGMTTQVNIFNANGQLIAGAGIIMDCHPGAGPVTASCPVPATAAQWSYFTYATPGASLVPTNTVTAAVTIYCQGQSPTSVNTPCCPPDPSVDLRLAAIQQMLTELLSLQALAGAYQETVHHTGLSGAGVLTINPASSAIRVDVVSDLTSWPQYTQTPTYYLSLGFITPYAVGTPLRGQRLIYNHQTFTWPSYTDQIGYTIASGLVVNIVELTRGA